MAAARRTRARDAAVQRGIGEILITMSHCRTYATATALAMALEPDGPDLVLRLAALMHDVGKPRTRRFEAGGGVSFHHHEVVGAKLTRKRLQELRFPKDVVDDVSRLVELHLRFHGYGSGAWTDSAVRRYVADAGPLLDRLHLLTRSDCTTRNRRKAEALRRTYDDLEARIARLREQEQLAKQAVTRAVRRTTTIDPRVMQSPRKRKRDKGAPLRPAAAAPP